MKRVLITLFLLVFIGIISAQSIELDYPSEVGVNEEFEVSLKLIDFEDVSYDVKIDITKDGKRISRVLVDDVFKSTFYYVKDALDSEGVLTLKIIEDVEGEADMIVRVRRSGGKSSELFGGYKINIALVWTASNSEEDEKETEEKFEKDKPSDEPVNIEALEIKMAKEEPDTPIKIEFAKSKDIKTESSTNFYKNLYGLSGILAISVFLLMVYIKKQGKYKNEFR